MTLVNSDLLRFLGYNTITFTMERSQLPCKTIRDRIQFNYLNYLVHCIPFPNLLNKICTEGFLVGVC
jgi:hypothetical protein